jgi:hypothetical protein
MSMKKASWILLTIVGAAIFLVSLISLRLAYTGDYRIGPASVADVAAGRPEVLSALRGIRGTSAAYANAYAILLLAVVLGPYRRGETWAWWALIAAFGSLLGLVALRIPLLGTQLGVAAPAILFTLVFVGLLDVSRLRSA